MNIIERSKVYEGEINKLINYHGIISEVSLLYMIGSEIRIDILNYKSKLDDSILLDQDNIIYIEVNYIVRNIEME